MRPPTWRAEIDFRFTSRRRRGGANCRNEKNPQPVWVWSWCLYRCTSCFILKVGCDFFLTVLSWESVWLSAPRTPCFSPLSVWDVPAAIGLQGFLLLIINHVFLWLFSHQCDANLRLRFEHKWMWCPQEWCKDRVCQCWRERKKEWKKTRDTVSRTGMRALWAGCSPPPHHSLFHTLINIRRRRACREQDRAS